MTRPAGTTRFATIGATTALLWLSPVLAAEAADQTLPGVTQRPGTEDTGKLMLGVKLPLHYQVKDAEQGAAGARLGAAQAPSEALRLRIDGQVADAWFSADPLRKVVQIYASRQLSPARLSVDNARNGFQAGSSDLSSVFESERRLRAVQLDLLKLKAELQAKYAEMERLAGGSL